jgi:hypothetical protein
MSINLIITVMISLIILVLLISFLLKPDTSSLDCASKGGYCTKSSCKNGEIETEIKLCKNDNKCCRITPELK